MLYIDDCAGDYEQMSDRSVVQTIWLVIRSMGNALVRFVMFLGAALKASVPGGAPPLPPDAPTADSRAEYRP